jgi:NDP-4-keto-2,6-dideoxyhexose 3-C-methyltransferase
MSAIDRCRVCGQAGLVPVLDLGRQALTGVFPRTREQKVAEMPLALVKCMEDGGPDRCGLLQLQHTGDLAEMYGPGYGYRSGLNRAMVTHLHGKVKRILETVAPAQGDLVIDIGSNDGTTLSAYPAGAADLVGIDPGGEAFRRHYPPHVRLIPEFFSARAVRSACGARRAKVITSFAMFYDLEAPMEFMRQVHDCLDDSGVWMFEQSYMPTMLAMNAYDTVCHEHLEYYGLGPILWMMERVGLRILDVELNGINGGSFSITAARAGAPHRGRPRVVEELRAREAAERLDTLDPYRAFGVRVAAHRDALRRFLRDARASGRTVCGYGASTKGNVLLQYCGVTADDLPCIAEVNEEKFGAFTPGTLIPIVSEAEARARKPDYFLVLPWHFRDAIVERERDYLAAGGKLVFPLPRIEVVGAAEAAGTAR